jgi:NAD-dependent deacetylase
MKKKIVVFTGAGISKESGIDTFRDAQSGLWYNVNVDDVATPEGWRKDREMVLKFYNERRAQLPTVQPNDAHKALVTLEEKFDITIVTQNVDDLHERAGSTNIIHLHGELTKARGALYDNKPSPLDEVVDIGYKEINIGDKCAFTGSQLRPHIVWFGEMPFGVIEAYRAMQNADILLIIGTSLQIGYTLDLLNNVRHEGDERYHNKLACEIYYIDPSPMRYLDNYGLKINYIEKTAVEGVTELVNALIAEELKEKID